MTRKKWSEVRDAHLRTPEDRARYQAAREKLERELAEYEDLTSAVNDPRVRLMSPEGQAHFENAAREWIARGQRAQAAVDRILADLRLDVEAGLADVKDRADEDDT